MLQEIKDLQNRAVSELQKKANGSAKELTFRAPTGSGKTRMMADFMNRVIGERPDVVFLVSTLSKGGLAQQNYNTFKECADGGAFPNIDPYLISTDISGEETLFIPTDKNVYVLPRDLYKKGGLLMQGAMENFLRTMTEDYFEYGLKKKIWLIKDECHVATNNLDTLSDAFFQRVLNFSATPNLKRRQKPDVQITDEEAVEAKLIKRVELYEDVNASVDDAINKLLEIKPQYNNLLGVNPCLIIQISNKDKATEEWEQKIKPAIDKHQELKWMLIMGKDKDKEGDNDTNDDVKRRLPVKRWRDYAKGKDSTIDIIVFKMVISEGWDIPRACMLFQVRDTKSKQLDEQVMGRVRRNPRLTDFETLSPQAKDLATTAWVWGIKPDSMHAVRQVTLWNQTEVKNNINVTTTKLEDLTQKADFDVAKLVESKPIGVTHDSIFKLWKELEKCPPEVQDLCYNYANDDPQRWWRFMEMAGKVRKEYDRYICDYDKSIKTDKIVSFPVESSYLETDQSRGISTWVWRRKDNSDEKFSFDSAAEGLWADVLRDCETKVSDISANSEDGQHLFLWGKNFPANSDIHYQYYDDGLHYSYPDFVLKDKRGRIHVFEVKSLEKTTARMIDEEEYKSKVSVLQEFYKHCSAKVKNHIFYLPILYDDNWQIFRYENGNENTISVQQFKQSL